MRIPEEVLDQAIQDVRDLMPSCATCESETTSRCQYCEEDATSFARAALSAAAPTLMAMALREAADEVGGYAWKPEDAHMIVDMDQASYMRGANDAHAVVDKVLRARANELEQP